MTTPAVCVFCASSTEIDPRYLQLADKVGRRSTGRAEAPSAGAAALAGLWGGRELDEDIGRIVAAGRRLLIWHCEDYPCLCCHARNSCAGMGLLMW